MRRTRLGDVYYVKVPNGYKIIQWGYSIPKYGKHIRVFDGLYKTVPTNILEIVSGPHSYIIPFNITRAYRVGLAQLIDNFPIPAEYPFPKYKVDFDFDFLGRVIGIDVMSSNGTRDVMESFDVSRMSQLPEGYRETTLLNAYISPAWLLYLFDNGFDMQHIWRFNTGIYPEKKLQKYLDIVERATQAAEQQSTKNTT